MSSPESTVNNTHEPVTTMSPASVAELVKNELESNPHYRMSNRLLLGIFLAVLLAVGLGVYSMIRRMSEGDRYQQEVVELKLQLKEYEKQIAFVELEKARERQLAQVASTQEAEGSVLTKLGRSEMPSKERRDRIDYIKAMTRRYLLVNAQFQNSDKSPNKIVEELCQIYSKDGYTCY